MNPAHKARRWLARWTGRAAVVLVLAVLAGCLGPNPAYRPWPSGGGTGGIPGGGGARLGGAGSPGGGGISGAGGVAGSGSGGVASDGGGGGNTPPDVPAAGDQSGGEPRPDTAVTPAQLRLGLLAYWRFDQGSGYGVAYDSSRSGAPGAQLIGLDTDTCWVMGQFQLALAFGVDLGAYVTVRPQPTYAVSTFTIAAWINRSGTPARPTTIFSWPTSGDGNVFDFGYTAGQLRASFAVGTAAAFTVTGTPAGRTGTWIHVAVTFDRGRVLLYEDGEIAGAAAAPSGTLPTSQADLVIGNDRNAAGYNQAFAGAIDDLLYYGRALPLEEIEALANGTEVPASDP